jgi:excisionase family DNA binding protein
VTPAGVVPAGLAPDANVGDGVPDRCVRIDEPRPGRKAQALPELPTLVTVADAARRLAVSLRTLRAIIAAGQLSVVRVSARRIAIDTADLAEFIERRRVRAGGR